MSKIQSVSSQPSLSDLLNAPPAQAGSSGIPPAARHQSGDTRNTTANKAMRDMIGLLEEAARHPEQIVDSTPAYRSIPLSGDEITAGWNSHAVPASGR